ncbi:permease [Amycolatopsis thermoflava]|uniref:permease n=1 Tax=Amycolatopsis thermoflava TaxID=84480 RepID=UPI0038024EF6
MPVLCAVLIGAALGQSFLVDLFDTPVLRTGSTVFVAVVVQALPFLVLGVLISGAVAAFLPADRLRRMLPRRTALGVPVAGLAGAALPGCECASVPVARRLMQQQVAPAVALAFLLASPAINPIVLITTAVAFPGRPEMALARFLGSLSTAVVTGWLWQRFGRSDWLAEQALRRLPDSDGQSRWQLFTETARHDLVDAGGFLIIGGLASAVLNVLVPSAWLDAIGGHLALGVIVMSVLAVILALCSEADAFVAASLAGIPLVPRLVFLVVGPVVDLKLIALQAGTFGRRFALRFAPLTFLVAIGCALVVGLPLLGGGR